MKIAIFTDTLLSNELVSGVDTSIKNNIKFFKKQKHEVCVFAPYKKETLDEEIKKEYWEGTNIYRIPAKESDFYPNAKRASLSLRQVREIVKKKKFDIFHIHTPLLVGSAGLLVGKMENVPAIGTFHTRLDDYFLYYFLRDEILQKLFGEFGKKSVEKLIKYYYSKCDYTITPSRTLLLELRRKKFKNLVQIPNGINLKKFKPIKNLKELRKKLKIQKDSKVILSLGRVGLEKKLDVLIKAFSSLKPEAYLIIAGTGPALEKYKNHVKKQDIKNVIFTGFVPEKEICHYYSLADIFVSPSDTEVLPYVFLEAMACGKPVIATKTSGGSDLVKNNRNGFLVKPGDWQELSRKMDYLLKNDKLREKMGKQSLKFIERYSIAVVSKELLDLYKKVIDKTKGHKNKLKILKIFEFFTREKTVLEKVAMSLVILVAITSLLFVLFKANPNKFYLTTTLILKDVKQSILKVLFSV